jgi:HEAT repeat protein
MSTRILFVLLLCWPLCGGCQKQKSTDALIEDLKGAQDRDRVIAVRTLPQRKGDAAKVIPALTDALKDTDSDVRWSAAIALGVFGEKAKDAIPALQSAQSDSDARVREAASRAITRIDPNALSSQDNLTSR